MCDPISDSLKLMHEIAPSATENAVENLTDEPTKFIGKTVTSFLKIIFEPINIYAEKLDYKRKEKLLNWKECSNANILEIEEDKRIIPPLEIAGPIIDASRYYFENDTLSKMFSNLLVSACNVDKIKSVHPAYVKILEQMSALDAKIMNSFDKNVSKPIAKYVMDIDLKDNPKSDFEIATNVFYIDHEYDDIDVMSASITNLERLGLLKLDYSHCYLEKDAYKMYEEDPTYKKFASSRVSPEQVDTFQTHTQLIKGTAVPTPFGNQFITACVKK